MNDVDLTKNHNFLLTLFYNDWVFQTLYFMPILSKRFVRFTEHKIFYIIWCISEENQSDILTNKYE